MKARIRKLFRVTARFFPLCTLRIALFRFGGVRVERGVSIARGVRVGESASLGESVWIGSGTAIGANVSIGRRTVVGRGCGVGDGTVLGEQVTLCELSKIANVTIGNGSFIERGVVMTGFKNGRISIGSHSYVGLGAVLDWSGGLELGDYVHIAGPSVGIWTHSSMFQALQGKALSDRSETSSSAVKIGDNVWIGGNSTIYPGTTIGPFAAVLPNSVVNRDVSTGTIVGGTPATVKRRLHREGAGIRVQKD